MYAKQTKVPVFVVLVSSVWFLDRFHSLLIMVFSSFSFFAHSGFLIVFVLATSQANKLVYSKQEKQLVSQLQVNIISLIMFYKVKIIQAYNILRENLQIPNEIKAYRLAEYFQLLI